jgi:multicomponent Na+:H+ antiporter subunit E
VILIGTKPADVVAGLATAVAATWVSLLLVPAGSTGVGVGALLTLVPRFLWQSLVAGMDVARRAFDPRLPLRPGFVRYPVRFPPGAVRNTFTSLTSLLPGTVPTGEENGSLVYHCLDVDQPVVQQLAAEEAALSRALGHE